MPYGDPPFLTTLFPQEQCREQPEAPDHIEERRGEEDGDVEEERSRLCSEEIAECLLALGRADEAQPYFAKAHEALSKDAGLVDNEPKRIERLAELGGIIQ